MKMHLRVKAMLEAENAILNACRICYIVILFLLIKLQTFFFKRNIYIYPMKT